MNSFGLKPTSIQKINSVFASYPAVQKVIIYGSRAKGNYRNGSDIDLTIIEDDLTFTQLNRIANDLDDLLLPYGIDLSQKRMIGNPDLIEHIERVGQVFYDKASYAAA